jgi:hypothetical protein
MATGSIFTWALGMGAIAALGTVVPVLEANVTGLVALAEKIFWGGDLQLPLGDSMGAVLGVLLLLVGLEMIPERIPAPEGGY